MKRLFREGYPNHVYSKCVDGNTPNNTHAQQRAEKRRDFISFNQALVSQFTRGYNLQHNRSGELFHKPFGSVPKIGEKYIKNNLSYINNNGASGNLSKGVIDYRWNLIAYCESDHPFSEKIVLNQASKRMRWAMRYVLELHGKNRPLDYRIQAMLFKGLNAKERKQLIDFIVVQYNFLDYSAITKHFGSFERALTAMDANTGSEHDIKEEWEDFSEYRNMIEVCRKAGYNMESINFTLMDNEDLFNLVILLSSITEDRRKIRRFLHLGSGHEIVD